MSTVTSGYILDSQGTISKAFYSLYHVCVRIIILQKEKNHKIQVFSFLHATYSKSKGITQP